MTDLMQVDGGPGPRTHALVIGVGRYRHLRGGTEPVADLNHMGLGQLSSTVVSARAFVEWILGEYANPAAPLGSVHVLLSPDEPITSSEGPPMSVDPATMANVKAAFGEWKARCSTDAANIALFYFAGHGVAKETLALLLEDFGASADTPFAESIDFDKTHLGMRRCKASLQCYWVDSCRSVPHEVLKLLELEATALIVPKVRDNFPRSGPVIHASASDERAYGRNDKPTQFTTALLRALRGLGTEKRNGRWVVTPSKLFLAVVTEMKRLARLELQKPISQRLPDQHPSAEGDVIEDPRIHEVAERPEVPVSFAWQPSAAAPYGTLQLRGVLDQAKVYKSPPGAEPWELEIPAGSYLLKATFDPPYRLAGELDPEILALPPGCDMTVEAVL